MEDSILVTIRELLIGDRGDLSFDADLVITINLAFNTLTQVGVGSEEGFKITGESEKWTDFVNDDRLEMIKNYVLLKVRVLFDPPTSSFVLDAYNKQLDELLWRINVVVDDQTGGGKNG